MGGCLVHSLGRVNCARNESRLSQSVVRIPDRAGASRGSMENVSTRSSCRFIRDESIPAARTKMELNTEAPRNSKNQVIALYLYKPVAAIYKFPIHRKKVRKKEPL